MTDDMLPGPMKPKPGRGDLEESFQDVMDDIDPAEKMPKPVPDTQKLGAIREDTNMMLERLDRMAVDGQQRADREAADAVEPVDMTFDDELEGFDGPL